MVESALPDRQALAGLVLAGGQGSRMGGRDKGWSSCGRAAGGHAARWLAPQVGRLIISANRNADSYARYGEVVGDGAAGLEDWPGRWPA